MSITAVIVDDEAPARKRLRDLLAKESDMDVVCECPDGPSAVDAILEHEPDVLFLDVQMPEMDGFEVLRLVGLDRVPVVVFVTAYDRHAVEAFEARALDYLLKPFTGNRFGETLDRVRSSLSAGHDRDGLRSELEDLVASGSAKIHRIPVRSGSRIHFVPVEDIDWIEGAGNYVLLHTSGQQHRIRNTLKGLAEKLGPQRFVRIHQSHVVNLDRVKELQPWSHGEFVVVMRDGTELTSSRTYSGALREMLDF
jgi:two-component system LytT family response regulator